MTGRPGRPWAGSTSPSQFIQETRPADISPWVPESVYARVKEAIADREDLRLGPIYAALNQEVPYEVIRLVITHLIATGRTARKAAFFLASGTR